LSIIKNLIFLTKDQEKIIINPYVLNLQRKKHLNT